MQFALRSGFVLPVDWTSLKARLGLLAVLFGSTSSLSSRDQRSRLSLSIKYEFYDGRFVGVSNEWEALLSYTWCPYGLLFAFFCFFKNSHALPHEMNAGL